MRFPYDSSLCISVKDGGNRGGLIGETLIDLETRYYSTSYAVCGLAKKYETSGYNAWRDINKPTHILEKLRKQWRLRKPEYFENANCLKIMKVDDDKEYNLDEISFKNSKYIREDLALKALHDWENITGVNTNKSLQF